ncbi:acetyltransferase [Tabrizicola sp. DMG-N-6]|uniref:Acetyltransferase n=1 Tax=Szabonella alba TaxID=2804194 RepID=A0A8K0VCM2_9RHOB|nr:acetyltransferase [Szabonella alba]
MTFRPVTLADLPLLADWLARPHWREWWGDAETELGYIRDMIEGRDTTEPFLFEIAGIPCGYIQMWRIADNRVEPWLGNAPWILDLPDHSVGVDLSLADSANLSRGIGSTVLRAFVALLRQRGQDFIIIDPDPANLRAVRAYAKAGFRPIPELEGRTGDCLLMRHHPED